MRLDFSGTTLTAFVIGAGAICAFDTLHAATIIQPDIRIGVSHLLSAGRTGSEEYDATGGELEARLKMGFISERNSVTLTPKIRIAEYSEERVTDREQQRLTFNWFHNFETAATSTTIDYNRQDLFSTEFDDPLLDPDEVPDLDDPGSGFVNTDSTRERLTFRQDFVKEIGLRNSIVFGVDYADVAYDDADVTPRVDYDSIEFGAGWRTRLSERTHVVLQVAKERYDGDNGLIADSLSGELGFDVNVSQTAQLSVSAGYASVDREGPGQDPESSGEFIFGIGGEKSTEVTRFQVQLARRVRPTSTGNLSNRTGLSFLLERKLSPRMTFGAGIRAFRQERGGDTAVGNDRDRLAGKLQLAWQLSPQWSVEASVRHTRQEFEQPIFIGGETTDDRSELFLGFHYRGLSEVAARSDSRFLSGF